MQIENDICQPGVSFTNKIKKVDDLLTRSEMIFFGVVSTNEDPWPRANQGSLLLGQKIER